MWREVTILVPQREGDFYELLYKAFYFKNAASPSTLIFGYALPDNENEPRPWASGKLGRKLHLFQLTCVMEKEDFEWCFLAGILGKIL